jgi:hypothetical protein
MWWTVEDVAISLGLNLYYRLGRSPMAPRNVRDDLGRSVVEAFAALPMRAMADRLDTYRAGLRDDPTSSWDGTGALQLVAQIVTFVKTFGPVGIGWGSEFAVRNDEADRLREQADVATWRVSGVDPSRVRSAKPPPYWAVNLWGHAPGRVTLPQVQLQRWYPDRPWAERVELGDRALPHDSWLPLVAEHDELNKTLDLVEAIAEGDAFACRRAYRAFYSNDDLAISVVPSGPQQHDLGRIIKGGLPANGRVKPFRLLDHQLDWVALATFHVADLIGRQIDFALPRVSVSDRGTFEMHWRATSVLEVVYLELLEHVRHRASFGVGRCEGCGGPILRTRHKGGTGNRWHPGCQSGRVRRWRYARRHGTR